MKLRWTRLQKEVSKGRGGGGGALAWNVEFAHEPYVVEFCRELLHLFVCLLNDLY